MKKFISLMMRKHAHALVHTGFINDAIDRIVYSGINTQDISVIESSLTFLKNEIGKDCENEEMYLYPIFGNIFREKIEKLKKEHRHLRSDIMNLENSINKLKENMNALEYAFELKEHTRQFNNIFIEHFREEKNLLLTITASTPQNNEIADRLMITLTNGNGEGI